MERLSRSNFKEAGIFLEKFVAHARHIEVQIFGDGKGRVVALGERDCSTQRRNQKVIEETPAPGLDDEQRAALSAAAIRLGEAVNYRSAGTVEFVFDADSGAFYFLEVNTRLQVEHGVTEEVCGVDLVEWMVRLAAGDVSFLDSFSSVRRGHSIQVRIYAEDPHKNFQPSCGLLTEVIFDPAARTETWVETGTEVTAFYDPMLAKIIVHAPDRAAAIARLRDALEKTSIGGIECNLDYLRAVIATPEFADGRVVTRFLAEFVHAPHVVDVVESGAQTTVQDFPGRTGFWNVGVPPSGPMDHLAHRFANRLLGNPDDAATLECVMTGPTLRFNTPTEIAVTGADFQAELNGSRIKRWSAFAVQAGDVLRLQAVAGTGAARLHRGAVVVCKSPAILGAARPSLSGNLVGTEDGRCGREMCCRWACWRATQVQLLPPSFLPRSFLTIQTLGRSACSTDRTARRISLLKKTSAMFFTTAWKVHYNSNPHRRAAHRTEAEVGAHGRRRGRAASVEHPRQCLRRRRRSISPATCRSSSARMGQASAALCVRRRIVQSELWKIGQLKPGDTVRFVRLSLAEANAREIEQDRALENLAPAAVSADQRDAEHAEAEPLTAPDSCVFAPPQDSSDDAVPVAYRRAGDRYLLVEYGPLVLDLALRFRVHALMQWLEAHHLPGILDLTPGIRSLQIHYDARQLPLRDLLAALRHAETQLPSTDEIEVPSRIIHLPLSWDDPATQLAIEKYMQSVRSDAPWCPSNLEFIRRINGLADLEEVKRIVFDASYLVLGLGDVYLGAPVATPLDPRHRLVTTKYNPARTWTPENAVGIGGAYLCIYGMEGPGGYQFVGRTVQCWNAWRTTPNFSAGQPWLLRFFDQIRFYPVSADTLLKHRADFLHGRFEVRVEATTFRLAEYQNFLNANAESIDTFRQTQRAEFAAERERWAAAGQSVVEPEPEAEAPRAEIELPPGGRIVAAHLPGSVWQLLVSEGDLVAAGEKLLILESMKMETAIVAPASGTVARVLCAKGRTVEPGQPLLVLQEG